ncbi:hypothetical protein BC937DRAFT_86621 [Endogone sp. FLAS-F59071]|nr:hypothetical protein BC937DRAFT_86621 [Endogone sp. FLAS-F59071]|eukprot:RUS19979.1 hypothetical protein BC937DRAFT_86621 [Endogone sp. FLAS-F59071]
MGMPKFPAETFRLSSTFLLALSQTTYAMAEQRNLLSRFPRTLATFLSFYYKRRLLLSFSSPAPSISRFSTSRRRLSRRLFPSKEEDELYRKLTSTFREQLAEKTTRTSKFYNSIIDESIILPAGAAGQPAAPLLTIEQLESLGRRIDAAGRAHNVSQLDALLSEAQHSRVRAVTTYNRLIRSYAQCRRLDRADAIHAFLCRDSILPTTRTLTYLIDAHLASIHHSETDNDDDNRGVPPPAMRYLDEMRALAFRPRTAFDFAVLIQLHARRDDTFEIEFLWRDAKELGVAGVQVCAAYLPWLVGKKGDLARGIEVWKEVVERAETGGPKGLPTMGQCRLLAPVVKAFANGKYVAEAHGMLVFLLSSAASAYKKIRSTATPISAIPPVVYTTVLQGYMSQSEPRRALEFYREMRTRYGVPEERFESAAAELVQMAEATQGRKEEGRGPEERWVPGYGMLAPAGWGEEGKT